MEQYKTDDLSCSEISPSGIHVEFSISFDFQTAKEHGSEGRSCHYGCRRVGEEDYPSASEHQS